MSEDLKAKIFSSCAHSWLVEVNASLTRMVKDEWQPIHCDSGGAKYFLLRLLCIFRLKNKQTNQKKRNTNPFNAEANPFLLTTRFLANHIWAY